MKKIVKISTIVLALAMLAAVLVGCNANNLLQDKSFYVDEQPGKLKTFSDEANLIEVIKASAIIPNRLYSKSLIANDTVTAVPELAPEVSSAANDASNTPDYSSTNLQTEGVDEGDIVKVDGRYIYRLNGEGFSIIEINDGSMTSVSKIDIKNYVPQEMYIYEDKLIIIGGIYETPSYDSGYYGGYLFFDCCWSWYSYSKTNVRVYDIANKSDPTLLRNITVDGNFDTSRLIDGKLIYSINYNFYYAKEDGYVPFVTDSLINDGQPKKLDIADIYYFDELDTYGYCLLGGVNLNDTKQSQLKGYLGMDGILYASQEYIYFARNCFRSEDIAYDDGALGYTSETNTVITKLSVETLGFVASCEVKGAIKDKFCIDEYDGNLRVATTYRSYWSKWYTQPEIIEPEPSKPQLPQDDSDSENSEDTQDKEIKIIEKPIVSIYRYRYYPRYNNTYGESVYSIVYVLDEQLKPLGIIDNIAEGESIYSCRFKEKTGSLVTFEQIDPYFNLDLSDPKNPKISKGLKEDGVSYYIHYLGDSGYTIGVGVDTEVNQWGGVSSKGIKISMYDNRSGEAVNVATTVLGDWGYTPLTNNSKALLYDQRIGLFAFPVSYYEDRDDQSYRENQGLAVFKFDTENGTMEYRGLLTNVNYVPNKGYNYYNDFYQKSILRGVRIGDYIYTISNSVIASYSLDTLEQISKLED